MEEHRLRVLGGRTFLESIIYTLTYLEFENRLETGVENKTMLAREFERQLCSLARAIPLLRNTYHAIVLDLMREYFPDKSLPELDKCIVYDTLLEWMDQKKIAGSLDLVSMKEARKKIQDLTDTIVYQAVMATFYKAGLLSY